MFKMVPTSRRPSLGKFRYAERMSRVCRYYLCGYSLRHCTMYSIVFDLVLLAFLLVIVCGMAAYININIGYRTTPSNKTMYYIAANDRLLFEVATYNVGVLDVHTICLQLLEVVFCALLIDLAINVIALVGVFQNQYVYLIPYVCLLANSIAWIIFFLTVDITLASLDINPLQYHQWVVLLIFLLQKFYKFSVILSYMFFYGKLHLEEHIRIFGDVQGLTTEKPMEFPQSSSLEIPLPNEDKISLDSNQLVIQTEKLFD